MTQIAAPSLTNVPENLTFGNNPGCLDKCISGTVKWFADDETSTVLKVGVLVLAAIALIGLGFLTGHPVLVPALGALLIGLPFGGLVLAEGKEQRNWAAEISAMVANAEAYNEQQKRIAAETLGKIKEAVGGEAAYDQMGVLEIDHRSEAFQPENLPASLMKGMFVNRPFIAVKVKDAEQEGRILVITFFQRYSGVYDQWTHAATAPMPNDPFGAEIGGQDRNLGKNIDDADRAAIHQIIVERNHPRFSLVE